MDSKSLFWIVIFAIAKQFQSPDVTLKDLSETVFLDKHLDDLDLVTLEMSLLHQVVMGYLNSN